MVISLIIPTLNAENEIGALLDSLRTQKRKVDEIIVVDSDSNDRTVEICKRYGEVRVISIKRKDFDHGRTRDMALRESRGDLVLFMTQDAVPADQAYIENLIRPFEDPQVAVVCGRQLARSDARLIERYVREFNYPPLNNIRTKADLERMGIKTFFSSDVCSAYRRNIYETLGGFEYPVRTNEDMFMAAAAINGGYKVAYAADAKVIHSHNLSLKEQYWRNYILGIELEKHKALLCGVQENTEGVKLVKDVSLKLLCGGHLVSFVYFGIDCFARLLGSKMGRWAARREKC